MKRRAKRASNPAKLTVEGSDAPAKRTRKPKAVAVPAADVHSALSHKATAENIPLRIPYGNKEVAQRLGARYAAGGWYAPPGVDLAAFSAQGWL